MAGLSDTMELRILQWMFMSTAFASVPSVLWYSLHSGSTVPDDGSGELAATGSYARAQLNPNTNNTPTSGDRYAAVANNPGAGPSTIATSSVANGSSGLFGDIIFPTATADWNTAAAIKVFGIWDHATLTTAVHFLGGGTINGTSGVVVLNGVTLTFPGGTMTVSLD